MNNKMKISVAVLAASVAAIGGIKLQEGYRAKPYYDIGKVATAGYGSTVYEDGRKVKITDAPVTKARADAMLRAHVKKDEVKLRVMLPGVKLAQAEYDVYVDFIYNFGVANFQKSSMRRELLRGDHKAACRALLRYKYAGGRDCSIRKNNCYGVWARQLERHRKCMAVN
ncbi:lysozyme [Neisseria weixii]|uniref:Lysozyme n=1 Tax=Neisseria weixii TaxID=1853276 RepID=A0A3N4MI00_9NEIS|nr:glycoside hydrolase family protein [Neisseria weixii]RPD83131.1 lysozyme [Neisseria weixii]RPD83281.1 lysozyme [Neisseria weixii]